MQLDDFRYSRDAPQLDVSSKKNDLRTKILQRHPHAKNMYTYVRSEFKESFGRAYNSRCAYCGVSMSVVPASCFEVDHIMCQDTTARGNRNWPGYVHDLDNLALACSYCNGKKSNFPIGPGDHEALSPDRGLGHTFVRKDDFCISIADELKGQEAVVRFYNKLNYGSELRRVDYLLSSLVDLRDKVDANSKAKNRREVVDALDGAIGKLMQKRNRFEPRLLRMHTG